MKTINFLKGYPHPSLLPAKLLSGAAQAALADPSIATPALLYGADPGYEPLRQAIAVWNTSFYGRQILKENITISGGASQNLACVLQVLTDPCYTQHVWISSPAYMLVFRIFKDHGFEDKLRAVPEVDDGLDTDWLERELEKAEQKRKLDPDSDKTIKRLQPYSKFYRHVVYCVPTFSNPSSTIMGLEKRKALVRLARKYDALIVADDVYDQLQWYSDASETSSPPDTAFLPRLVDIDADIDGGYERSGADGFGNSFSNGSFSKLCSPGGRCGWTDGSVKLAYSISQAGSTTSGGAPSQLVSSFMAELLNSGKLQKHIAGLRTEYAERYQIMAKALETFAVPLGCTISVPKRHMGGFFIWVGLPQGMNADELSNLCKDKHHLIVAPGTIFEVPASDRISHDNYVRLCFSWEDKEHLGRGVKRLAQAMEEIKSSRG